LKRGNESELSSREMSMKKSMMWIIVGITGGAATAVVAAGCSGDDSSGVGGGGLDSGTVDGSTTPDAAGGNDSSPGLDGATAHDSSLGASVDAAPDADASSDGACPASWFVAPTVPDLIQVPADGGTVFLHGAGAGTQNYACGCPSDGGTCEWALVAPAAQLSDCNGNVFAVHAAPTGPTHPQWQASDGSLVVGMKVNVGIAPDGGNPSVNWVLIQAVSYGGDAGIMDGVLYVQRLDTDGGEVPTSMTCDEGGVGTTYDAPYTADYYFWGN
jgi:hypothetical protein